MPEQVWPHALHVVDVLVAVDVPHASVFRPREEKRDGLFAAANLARDAARDQVLGAGEQFA